MKMEQLHFNGIVPIRKFIDQGIEKISQFLIILCQLSVNLVILVIFQFDCY